MTATVPTRHLRAMWPVTDESTPLADLHAEAVADLPAVAMRAGGRVVRHTLPRIVPGRSVPGSGGAHLVVLIDAVVVAIRDMPERAVTRSDKGRTHDYPQRTAS